MTWILSKITGNPLLLLWIALGAFAFGAVTAGGVAWKVQGWRLDSVQAKFDGFVATTKAQGEAAQKLADAQIAAGKLNKERADRENIRTLATLRADVKRLRDANPSGGIVPAAAAGSLRPDLACLERTEFSRAVGVLMERVRGLIDEGDTATIGLDTAKGWARGNKLPVEGE